MKLTEFPFWSRYILAFPSSAGNLAVRPITQLRPVGISYITNIKPKIFLGAGLSKVLKCSRATVCITVEFKTNGWETWSFSITKLSERSGFKSALTRLIFRTDFNAFIDHESFKFYEITRSSAFPELKKEGTLFWSLVFTHALLLHTLQWS